ncbi:low temperature requirement protein A [Streptomyces sp. NPDC051776]|uniref:low temperature requirement protein A n=1 Tax=Streptomyces sp. NPDC051776 TaxID=3155414 RepID=UPI0034235462
MGDSVTAAGSGPAGAGERERHAAWLELFFDLVFVAVAAQLAHGLHGDPEVGDFALFLALYFPAWWTWINVTAAMNVVERDSPRRRLLVLWAMLCLAAMAAALPGAVGDRAPAYALGFAGARLALMGLWWPATAFPEPHRLPKWRPLTYCLAAAALWSVSAFVPSPWCYVVWAVLITAEMPLLMGRSSGGGLLSRLHTGHLVERVGLVVIIVLGEAVLGLVTSTDHHWAGSSGLTAVLGFVLIAALWWSYFDFGSAAAERALHSVRGSAYRLARDTTGFLYFFVTAAVIAMAAGLATAVEEAHHAHLATGALWALAGGQALYHAAHAAIALRVGRPPGSVAVWTVPGVGVPLLIVLLLGHVLAPWAVVLLLVAEAVAHLLYADAVARRRRAAGLL